MDSRKTGPITTAAASVLLFRLERRSYAIFLSHVSGLCDTESVRKVIGAPRGILGLAPWHGRVLTVLDLPVLLGDRPTGYRPSIVRLASPFTDSALFIPASITMENLSTADLRPCRTRDLPVEGILRVGDDSILLLAPDVIIERIENGILGVAAISSLRDDGEIVPLAQEG